MGTPFTETIMRFSLSLLLCLLLTMSAWAQEAPRKAVDEPKTVELPVTRAVLFSSGVGYFEHAG